MEREEFIALVEKHDRIYGNYLPTLQFTKRRSKRLKNVDVKIIKVVEYLQAKGVGFMIMENICKPTSKCVMFADIYIPKYRIYIRNVEDTDKSRKSAEIYYKKTFCLYYPIFSRHNESFEFLITKLENTFRKAELTPLIRKFSPELSKKKKPRIKHIKVL